MDYVLNYGQGFVIFALFALDSRIVVLPVLNRLRRTLNLLSCDRRRRLPSNGESGNPRPVAPNPDDQPSAKWKKKISQLTLFLYSLLSLTYLLLNFIYFLWFRFMWEMAWWFFFISRGTQMIFRSFSLHWECTMVTFYIRCDWFSKRCIDLWWYTWYW